MKLFLTIILLQLLSLSAFAQRERAEVAFISENLKYTLKFSCRPELANVVPLEAPEGLQYLVVDDLGIRANYRDQHIEIARRENERVYIPEPGRVTPARRSLCRDEFTLNIEGQDINFHRYEMKQATVIDGNSRDTKKLVLLDPRARALLVEWETGYCEDPGDAGNILITNPEDIFFMKDVVHAMDQNERVAQRQKILNLLGVNQGEGDFSSITVRELDLPISNLKGDRNFIRPQTNLEEDYLRILVKMNSTQLLINELSIPINPEVECN
jgi:hypothetical protein